MRRMAAQCRMALAVLMLAGCTPPATPTSDKLQPIPVKRWAAYYGSKTQAKAFKDLDLVVFDRRYHPDFKQLKPKTTVLAYVSAGEVHDDIPEKNVLEKNGLLLFQQPHWKSHVVDVTSPLWQSMVMRQVDAAVADGFDGVMLDTIDSPIAWSERHAPERVEEMREAFVSLIETVRVTHPKIKIMMNRGLDILPEVATKIDFMLAESILTHVNVSTGQFSVFPPTSYRETAGVLRQVVTDTPRLQILTLDYWNQDDVLSLRQIYATHRAFGFAPYVTTADLKNYTPEPRVGE